MRRTLLAAVCLVALMPSAHADGFGIEIGPAGFGFWIAPPTGAVLLCNQYGCRSSPYLPPPIIPQPPAVVYSPTTPPPPPSGSIPFHRPMAVPALPAPTRRDLRLPDFPPQAYGRARRDPPPRPPSADPEGREIERDITTFCEAHPDEPFCVKLADFLQKHPEARPQ